ncbi:MAG: hydrogenase maturation nickel metallochaperone HypA [bacterium]|nr:hydrogenase maturation nickel metallochaperone HypA [bacterium]
MHELGIITNIFHILEDVAAENHLTSIRKVKLTLGKLQQIVPETLSFAFEAVAKDTKAEGAVLEVEYVPIRMKCQSCEQEFIVDNHLYICPECEHTNLQMLAGMEVILESVEGDRE